MLAQRESSALAETTGKEEVEASQLAIHADRGLSMRSRQVIQLLANFGATKMHSWPHASNGNSFSKELVQDNEVLPKIPIALQFY